MPMPNSWSTCGTSWPSMRNRDGLAFDAASIGTERITEDADYEGVRIRFPGTLDTARFRMQIDVGFGDVVYPEPEALELPTLLDFPAPRLLCYSREASIAEKLETMVKFGMLNSRMKDFLRHLAAVPTVRLQWTQAGRGHSTDFRETRHHAAVEAGGSLQLIRS